MGVEFDRSEIGSVGQLVGAALETAGHYMQGVMLEVLDAGLASSIGLFLFTIAAVVAIFTIAVGGNYKAAKWFFFGPLAFLALVNTRTTSGGAAWEFGDRRRPSETVRSATEGIVAESGVTNGRVTEDGEPATVTLAFSLWNRIVSGFVQSVVATINLTKDNSDLEFITQADRFTALFQAQVPDSNVKTFVNMTAVSKCADYYVLMREYYNPSTDEVRRDNLRRVLEQRGRRAVVSSQDIPELMASLKQLGVLEESRDILGAAGTPNNEDLALNCNDLWALSIRALQKLAPAFIDSIADTVRSPEMPKFEARRRLEEKHAGILLRANRYEDAQDENQQALLMINQVAARMMLQEFQRVNPNLVQGSVERNLPVEPEYRESYLEDIGQALRDMQKTEAWVGKGDFLTAVLALPNVQGFILYWLAVGFPFFALTLVLPGRHTAIFTWMGLWLWVKSWDIGFAIVMLIDKLLFALLPNPLPLDNTAVMNPGVAIKSMLQVDLSYNQLVYYNTLATLIAGVPLITGLVVRKGGKEVVSYVGNRLSQFSGRVGYAMASHARSMLAQSFAARAHHNTRLAVERGLYRAIQDPEVAGALGQRGLLRLGAALAGRGGYWANVAAALSNAPSEQKKMFAMAKIEEHIAEAAYGESMMWYNRRYAQRAIFQTYYNHDFVFNFPGTQKGEVIKALHYFPFGGAMQSVADGAFRQGLLGTAAIIGAGVAANLPVEKPGMEGTLPESGRAPSPAPRSPVPVPPASPDLSPARPQHIR